MPTYVYTEQFVKALETIFKSQSYFLDTFGGSLQIVDGVSQSDTFLKLKTVDQPTVIQTYSTDGDVGMGAGTASSSRFGEINEIKAVDTTVGYEAPLAIHEGIDNFTVNGPAERIVLERLAKVSEAWTQQINGFLSTALSENAGQSLYVEMSVAGVTKLFNDARTSFVNNEVDKNLIWKAYVTPELYSFLSDNQLISTSKRSNMNIDTNSIPMFKGFVIEEIPNRLFSDEEVAVFVPNGVGVAGTGIQVVRTIDAIDFYGTQIQGAAKYAKYIPEVNHKAIIKAVATTTPEA